MNHSTYVPNEAKYNHALPRIRIIIVQKPSHARRIGNRSSFTFSLNSILARLKFNFSKSIIGKFYQWKSDTNYEAIPVLAYSYSHS